jgi:hypothetical protein
VLHQSVFEILQRAFFVIAFIPFVCKNTFLPLPISVSFCRKVFAVNVCILILLCWFVFYGDARPCGFGLALLRWAGLLLISVPAGFSKHTSTITKPAP